MAEHREIACLTFPHDDADFAAAVDRHLHEILAAERDPRPQHLLLRLRPTQPLVAVVAREPLAELWPRGHIWYVYRDGSAVAARPVDVEPAFGSPAQAETGGSPMAPSTTRP
jgi:hypothetical protein